MKKYIVENWDGWPLHSLIAGLALWLASHYSMEVMLLLNTVFWFDREAKQHDGYANVWTFHRIMEWGCPMVVGLVTYVVLT